MVDLVFDAMAEAEKMRAARQNLWPSPLASAPPRPDISRTIGPCSTPGDTASSFWETTEMIGEGVGLRKAERPVGRQPKPAGWALGWRVAGLIWTIVYVLLASLFVIGEGAYGGWLLGVGGWVVGLLVLMWLAFFRPRWALPVLGGLLAVELGWLASTSHGGPSFGPLDVLAGLAVSAGLGVLGWHRPAVAGILLLVATTLPIVFKVIWSNVPTSAVLSNELFTAVPWTIAALLYLLSTFSGRGSGTNVVPMKGAPSPS